MTTNQKAEAVTCRVTVVLGTGRSVLLELTDKQVQLLAYRLDEGSPIAFTYRQDDGSTLRIQPRHIETATFRTI